MRRSEPASLWEALSNAGRLAERRLWAQDADVALGDLAVGTSLGARIEDLRGRSVLVATTNQLATALALIELDGVASRLVLCPPDLKAEHVRPIAATAGVDAIVSDDDAPDIAAPGIGRRVASGPRIASSNAARGASCRTEWILLTSGTTGVPKMVVHTLGGLTGAIQGSRTAEPAPVWSTFYDVRRYGGLQILLRALIGGGSMVLSSAAELPGEFLARVAAHGVTHISGTPSHWRRALMSPAARSITPSYIRLSGEIADQAILDMLRAFYPRASIAHAYASTEAGVAFEVGDGLAGFPESLVGSQDGSVEMKAVAGSLCIRSGRTAIRYLGSCGESLADGDGFVDTGDMVELRDGRYHFVGRRGGIINVGGLKVHPEEVEAVINRHPNVQMSVVRGRRNPITGSVVVADVLVRADPGDPLVANATLESEIRAACKEALPAHKVPAAIRFVSSLDVAASGKLARRGA